MLVLLAASFLLSAQSALSSSYVSRPWETSSYCNAPHVNASHYKPAEEGAELVHLSVVMRHHKRAPVALVPNERDINVGTAWNCSDTKQFTYAGGGARLSHSVTTPPGHPFARKIWAGSCEEGQLTAGGFHDSRMHGKDLWELYHTRLGFLHAVHPDEIDVRTTFITRTKHVASGVLAGMDPSISECEWAVHTQPERESIDSLAPSYQCPRADALVAAAQAASVWQDILTKNSALRGRLDSVLGTNSDAAWRSTFVLYQDIVTSRVCHDLPLPCNVAGECISEEDAANIFELGDIEADYLFHRAEGATEYNQLTFGVMFSELADALTKPKHRLALYVAHDASIVRLAAGLEIFPLRWPRLGSEIVIEVWRDKQGKEFVRVLYDGELVGSLSWTPLSEFISLLRRQVPNCLFQRCMSVSVPAQMEDVKSLVPSNFIVQKLRSSL